MPSFRNLTGHQLTVCSVEGTTVQARLEPDPLVISLVDDGGTLESFAGVDVRTLRLKHVVANLPARVAGVGLILRREVLETLADRGLNRPDLCAPARRRVVIDGEMCHCGLMRYLD